MNDCIHIYHFLFINRKIYKNENLMQNPILHHFHLKAFFASMNIKKYIWGGQGGLGSGLPNYSV